MLRTNQFHGGQFTLSTQLIKPNYLVILPPTQHHSFFRNLPSPSHQSKITRSQPRTTHVNVSRNVLLSSRSEKKDPTFSLPLILLKQHKNVKIEIWFTVYCGQYSYRQRVRVITLLPCDFPILVSRAT